jgi:hypothetical protein
MVALFDWLSLGSIAFATGTGPDVTVTDNGDGTVTMANGVVLIQIVNSGASINQIDYTYNNVPHEAETHKQF